MNIKQTLTYQFILVILFSYTITFSFIQNSIAQDIFEQSTSTSSSTGGTPSQDPPQNTSTSSSTGGAPEEQTSSSSSSTGGTTNQEQTSSSSSTSGTPPQDSPPNTSTSSSSSTSGAPEQVKASENIIITSKCNGKDDCSSCLKEVLSPRTGSPYSLCCLSSKHQNLNANGCP